MLERLLGVALLPTAFCVWAGFVVIREVAARSMATDVNDVWDWGDECL